MTHPRRRTYWLVFALLAALTLLALACRQPAANSAPSYQPPVPAAATPPPPTDQPPATDDSPQAIDNQPSATNQPQATDHLLTPFVGANAYCLLPTAHCLPTTYLLDVLFDPPAHAIQVAQQIHYTNLSTDTLAGLLLIVEPNRLPGEFELQALHWLAGAPVQGYRLLGERLEIPLPQPLQPGDSLGLRLHYRLALPALETPFDSFRPLAYGYTNRQSNFVDWYPFLPAYRAGQGWLVNPVGGFGEHLVYDSADYDVTIRFTSPQETVPVAASAPTQPAPGGGWQYHLSAARTFTWSAGEQYQVISQTVGSVAVYSYFFPTAERGGRAALQITAQALALYSELFGDYPYHSLSVVEADFNDGMEYAGLYFLSRSFYAGYDNTPANYLTLIAAHETAHQWWYGLVGSDPANQPWLDEALATYSEFLYYQRYHPDLSAWWQQFRVDPYQPHGSLARRIYDFSSFRAYRDGIYLRGAQFLAETRLQLGDERFFTLLRQLVALRRSQIATTADFFAILEAIDPGVAADLKDRYFAP